MTGYSPFSPVSVTGTPTNLRITGCPGYNDRNLPLLASPGQLTTGISAATLTNPYYGPSIFMYMNTTITPITLYIFGQAITANNGIYFLPNAYDTFHFSIAPTMFTWIGK